MTLEGLKDLNKVGLGKFHSWESGFLFKTDKAPKPGEPYCGV